MKRRHHKAQSRAVQTTALVHTLQAKAQEKSDALGHELGLWQPAKKKHGAGAMKALCSKCGEVAFIMPYLCLSKEHPQVPGIKGPVLFEPCAIPAELLP